MSSSSVKETAGDGGAKPSSVASSKKHRSTTPVSERVICRGGGSVHTSTGKENANSFRSTSTIRAATKPHKPFVPPMARADKNTVESRARLSTNVSTRPTGRSSSPSVFDSRITSEVRKPRVPRVDVDRNQRRSVSVDRSTTTTRVSDRVGQQNKEFFRISNSKSWSENHKVANSKFIDVSLNKTGGMLKESKPKPSETRNVTVSPEIGSEGEIISQPETSNTQSGSDSVMKVSESVKLFEKFESKVGYAETDVGLNLANSSGKLSRGVSFDSSKEKGISEDITNITNAQSDVKYSSKLHGKLAFLEEKVKRIASDIKRTKEMLDMNNPDASKAMLSDIQETVAGIEKAMVDAVSGEDDEKGKKDLSKVKEGDILQIDTTKRNSPIKDSSDTKSLSKGLNTDELEARFFPHHRLLRDRSTLKAPIGSHENLKTEVINDQTCILPFLSNSFSKGDPEVTNKNDLEICEVEETGGRLNPRGGDSSNTYSGKRNLETMLTADETLEECDEDENKEVMIFLEEIDDGFSNQLNEIGHKTATGGWFVSEGESVLLAHDDGSCTFYDVANSEEKSLYNPPAGIAANLWRDCWIVRAPGVDGCSGRYVVAASAGNGMDSGFCSWDFYTKEMKSFHLEDTLTNPRTALAPLSNNVLNRRHDLTNLTPENRQWWYKPCGPLIVSTASNHKGVRIYDIRDGEDVMKWDLQSFVSDMENSSPLQWRNREKVVLAETGTVCLWDVASLTPEPLLSVSSNGKKITALHINNTDAEPGGGVRQRVSSSEAEGNDGVFCTSDSINILDFRHPSGVGLKIPKHGTPAHSVFSRGDSIYLGCSGPPPAAAKPPPSAQIQHFSLRKQTLFTTYILPESNSHPHYKAITQVWGNSDVVMGVCGLGLFVFDALKDDGLRPLTSGENVRETIGPDNLYCPSFDYMGSRALLISRDRPAVWKYLA